MKKILFFILVTFATPSLFAQDFDTIQVKRQNVRGTIDMIKGWGGNIAILPGADGVVMIDDQFSELNPKIMNAIAEVTDQPVRFIINTHFHYDHTDGNKVMGKPGVLIIAQDNVRKRLSTDQVIPYYKQEQKALPPSALPKVTFEDSLTFHMNGEEIRIYHFNNAHTDGDAIVYFVNSNVVHMGDVFFSGGFPFVDVPNGGSVPGIIDCVDKILKRTNDRTLYIPGHGTVTDRKGLIKYNEMLRTITGRVKAEVDKGKLLSEINVDDMISGYENTGGRPAPDFIMFAYLSLTEK